MSQPSAPRPRLDVRGAVDLSVLQSPPVPAPGEPGGLPVAAGYTVDATTTSFGDVVQASTSYPVVVLLWSRRSAASIELARDLGRAVDAEAGAVQLVRVDIDAEPQIAAAFQVQTVPAVVALLAGQPIPLFQGTATADQLSGLLGQLLQAAATNGIAGVAPGAPMVDTPPEAEAEPPLPPLHQAAYDAIERDDLPTAIASYEQALRENPRDDLAREGLAQVRLMDRTRDLDPVEVNARAAMSPKDLDAQMQAADVEIIEDRVEDAFGRLTRLVAVSDAERRELLRLRLVELFDVVGGADPRVMSARRALASALY
ncbi:thioredoxin 2 [mine drainage metagenome]|uniref:Thioredoxin 2 n=1 Tax=mine drainage metagenome TaxID=410659 RepID=A0A1J5QJU0_9ZZZZ